MKYKYKLSKREWLDLIIICITCVPGKIYKHFAKPIWLVSERKNDAQDNGYSFFKYMRTYHPSINIYYVISSKSEQFKKVAAIGQTIKWGGLKHHLLFWACTYNLGAHIIEGMPSPRICHTLNNLKVYNFKNIFLQHGVTKDNIPSLSKTRNRIDLFVCVGEDEQKFVEETLLYNKGEAVSLGFSRYDYLVNSDTLKNTILIMPTWRMWIDVSSMNSQQFIQTEYYTYYNKLLMSEALANLCESYNLRVIFYLHDNLQQFTGCFSCNNKYITIASKKYNDVQNLLKTSSILITDYSSVFFDFAYMHKPVIYYQFDYIQYRIKHYTEGYFSYENDGFGPVVYTQDELIKQIKKSYDNKFGLEDKYKSKIKNFFKYNDTNNSDRIYKYVSEITQNDRNKHNNSSV